MMIHAVDPRLEPDGPAVPVLERGGRDAEEGTILKLKRDVLLSVEEKGDAAAALQAMWEERWRRLGIPGKQDWFLRHGEPPPEICPMLG